jgi:GT2 family glycosyltransferase
MYPEAVMGGRTVNALVDNPYSAASQLLVDYLYARWNPSAREAIFFASNNLALPAKSFNTVGGFDIRWTQAAGEDRDLCDRLIAHGYRMVFVPDALVQHVHCLSFPASCRQHFNSG